MNWEYSNPEPSPFFTRKKYLGTTLEDLKALHGEYKSIELLDNLRQPTDYQLKKIQKHTGPWFAFGTNVSKYFEGEDFAALNDDSLIRGTYCLDQKKRLCVTFDFERAIGKFRQSEFDLGTECNINKVVLLNWREKIHSFPVPSMEDYQVLYLPNR